MDKEVEKLKEAISKVPGIPNVEDDAELCGALTDIDQSLKALETHPHSEEIHQALSEAVQELRKEGASEESSTSRVLHRLSEDLNRYEDTHPGVTLLVSRLANALAVYGL